MLTGNAVAFFVNGFNGGTIPGDVFNHLIDLANRTQGRSLDWDKDNDGQYEIYETNWNSPNPRLGDGNPGSFFGDDLQDFVQFQTVNVFGQDIPVGATVGFANRPEPATPTQFVDALANILDNEYDDGDFIALIGHSLGGNSVLRVAQQAHRQIDFLATLDPVGWSFTGTPDPILNTQIIPPIVIDNPFSDVVGPDNFEVYGGLNVGIPIDDIVVAVTAGLSDFSINPDTRLPRGRIGFRNELTDPNDRVEYFYNRWQQEYFFPFDFLTSGRLDTGDVRNSVNRFSYNGRPIDVQSLSDTNRDANGIPIERNSNLVDILFNNFGVRLNIDADWGSITNFKFPPDVSVDLSLGRTSAQTHASLPVDPYIQAELNTILDNITPQPPVAVASVVPIGRPFQEGDSISLSSAGSRDPNPDDTLIYHWRQIGGPTVTLSDPSAPNPSFVATDDTFLDDTTIRFELTVTDNTGANDTAVTSLTVQNVPPALSPITGPDTFVRAFVVPLAVPFNDPGTADVLSASWNFGDGTITPFAVIPGTTGTARSPAHAYRNTGTFTVRVRVRDDDATVSVQKDVTIEVAGIITDPDDPTKTALAVGGSTGDDTIILEPTNVPGQVRVTLTNSIEGVFQKVFDLDPSSRVLVAGGEGQDSIEVRGDLGRRVDIDGGPGLDTITVTGGGTDTGSYTPSGTTFGVGSITLNSSPINFLDVEAATVGQMGSFRVIMPNSVDDVTIGPDPNTTNRNQVSGSSNAVDFTPLSFSGITDVTIDTGASDGSLSDDSIFLRSPGLVSAGLQNFTVNSGSGSDTFVIDSGLGLPVPGGRFVFNAGGPSGPDNDRLLVTGNDSNIGVYVPDAVSARAGILTEDGSSLNFTDLEDAIIASMSIFTIVTPNTGDNLRIEATPFSENRVSGSVGQVAITRATFSEIDDVILDAASRQTDSSQGDAIDIENPGGAALVASRLRNFTIKTGPGNDTLTINAADFRLPVAAGQFLFDSGSGRFLDTNVPHSNQRGLISLDRIVVNADVDYLLTDIGTRASDETPPEGRLAIAPAGSGDAANSTQGGIRLIGVEGATLTGGSGNNRMDASGFSGSVVLNGVGGNDTLIGGSGDNVLDGGEGNDILFAGDDRFARPGLGSQANVLLGGGGKNLLLGRAGQDTFHADLLGTATLIGGGDDDTFIVINSVGLVTAPVGGITIDGGGQPGDTLRLVGGGGPGYNQIYMLGASAGEGRIVTTNNHNPTGPTISQYVRFTGVAAIDDSLTANELNVLGTSASAPIAGASAADLASGLLRLTMGGIPFAVITFANKLKPSVRLADGQVVTAAAPVVAAPLTVTVSTSRVAAPQSLVTDSATLTSVQTVTAPAETVALGRVSAITAPVGIGSVARRFGAAKRLARRLVAHPQRKAVPAAQRAAKHLPKGSSGGKIAPRLTARPAAFRRSM